MAKQKQEEEEIDYEPRLRMPKKDVIQKVRNKIEAIDDLMHKTSESIEFDMWYRATDDLLIHAFGSRSKQVQDFRQIRYYSGVITEFSDTNYSYRKGLQSANACLSAIVKELEEFYPDEGSDAQTIANVGTVHCGANKEEIGSNKVFVVHGHDEGMKASVARFLEKLGLQPIILHEQPNGGKTIIEKFEGNTDVAFAVILISPDDEGCEKGKREKLQNRARQNVILELGYFIGRLSRAHVCALQSGKIEIPTDILGVVYIPYDSNDGWKIQLCKELRAAGLPLDEAKIASALIS